MFAIRENTKTVLGESVTTYSREICDACCLEIEAGTNGYKGGDAGHGSRTYFRIANDALKFILQALEDGADEGGWQ